MPNPKKEYLYDILSDLDKIPSIIQAYSDFLIDKISIKKVNFKNARTNLRTAIGIYQANQLVDSQLPTQKQIEQYAKKNPASRKKLVSFVCFLNNYYDCGLVLKTYDKPVKWRKSARTQLVALPKSERKFYEQQFIELTKLPKPLTREQKLQWVMVGIGYFHEIKVDIAKLSNVKIVKNNDFDELMMIKYKGFTYALPDHNEI